MKKLLIVCCAVAILASLIACRSLQSPHVDVMPVSESSSNPDLTSSVAPLPNEEPEQPDEADPKRMTKDELSMLQSFYPMDEIPDVLSEKQKTILTEYRYLRQYLKDTYPTVSFKSPCLSPGGGLLGAADETFYFSTVENDTCKFVIHYDAAKNTCELVYDGYQTVERSMTLT